jgi:hypothetical protein
MTFAPLRDDRPIGIGYPAFMRPKLIRNLLLLGLPFAALGLFIMLDFDGDLDFGGHHEVLKAVPYSEGQIAFEIERWDNQALNGPRYAVIIDDHIPSTFELRRAIISFWQRRSFELANENVSMAWSGPNLLTLGTDAPNTSPDWVMNQPHRIGNVVIQYTGRP